ncbi:MAG: metal-dependent transcriptional regulator [Coriobacteriia bacterium]|nr:metal-dependent transcriptional regulator [Coriobacteriia bacterium]MCL2536873.1 metal-dependent transcriptional regulator [Coriobacteriia bacterium]
MKKVTESVEDYLEAILVLGKHGAEVRSIDVAHALQYSKPSVSVAMKNLRELGYIEVGEGGAIVLTPAGAGIAQSVYERHKLISDWLIYLGVDEQTALRDACKMEHGLSDASYHALKAHISTFMQP